MSSLEQWIARQWDHAAEMMLKSVSPVDIVKARPHFGQVIVPRPGSVVASPVLAGYDPDPDYFFHWYRDSAAVIDALRLLRADLPKADSLFQDFVRFSLDLAALDGRRAAPGWRDAAAPEVIAGRHCLDKISEIAKGFRQIGGRQTQRLYQP